MPGLDTGFQRVIDVGLRAAAVAEAAAAVYAADSAGTRPAHRFGHVMSWWLPLVSTCRATSALHRIPPCHRAMLCSHRHLYSVVRALYPLARAFIVPNHLPPTHPFRTQASAASFVWIAVMMAVVFPSKVSSVFTQTFESHD
jgi:hypothetical protein